MKEEILKLSPILDYISMANHCYTHHIEYIAEAIEWDVVGNEEEEFEIDIWLPDCFIELRYNIYGKFVRAIVEEN